MSTIWLCALILLFTFYSEFVEGIEGELKTYIVHVSKPEAGYLTEDADHLSRYHRSFLPTRLATSGTPFIYSYSNVISGFAARLTEEDVEAMRNKDGFISARPERIFKPMTTHSPQFLGLRQELGFLKDSQFGKGVILGVLDVSGGSVPGSEPIPEESKTCKES